MSLAYTINCSCIFLILNLILCQYTSHKVNDLHKNTTAIERIKLSNKISHFRIQHLKMINWLCQLQSNFWWSLLAQQLHQNHSQSIQTLSKKSTFVVIRIDMNVSSEINCNYFILFNYIMSQKISILTTRISIMSTWNRFKIIRISVLIKKNQNNLSLILKIILLIMLIFLIWRQEFADSVNRALHLTICFISIF